MNYQWSMPRYEPLNFPQVDVVEQFNTTLFSGVICGLLPLMVAVARGRPDWGFRAIGVCFLAGIFKGYWLAFPVGLVMTAVVILSDPRARAKWNRWTGWEREAVLEGEGQALDNVAGPSPGAFIPTVAPVAPAPIDPAIPTVPVAPAFAKLEGTGASALCTACGAPILPKGDRLPPWCPRCGADFKAQRAASPGPQLPPAVSGSSH
jgi:hypothetical protein